MERALFASWLLLAAVHAMPAAVLFAPRLTERLYGVAPGGAVGILIVHRGALFLAVLAVAVLAAFSPDARRAASLVVGISVVAFLTVYAASGMPSGQLRTIALADAVALAPLALVTWAAWSR
ncbi:hypothetical protein [Sphingomonas lenta]|uniref:hypothetical protein n=1 Tax=Sphingomonas lenta TaxID=1141887 RepID=UPI001140D0D2|nr:hypothetical protein [Sphingomonas lenta]